MADYKDCFDHDFFADALLRNIESMPAGSILGIQAPWGRGKTDLLKRVWNKAEASPLVAGSAWLDPWRSSADYLQPLLKVLAQTFRDTEHAQEAMEVCQWLVTSPVGPAGYIRLEFVKKLFGLEGKKDGVYDSQEFLARFHGLIQKLISSSPKSEATQFLICVDDLDRCPPGQQVPLLESFFFLAGGGPGGNRGPTFVLSYDFEVLSAAVRAHFGALDSLDAERFLDKIFAFRVNLPSISDSRQESKIVELCRETDLILESRMLAAFFEEARETRNPRLLERAFSKYRFACRTFDPEAEASPDRFCLLVWLILVETWPDLRLQYQRLAKERKPSQDSPFMRLLMDAHTIIAHGGERTDRNLFLARLFDVTHDSAVDAGNIFIQVLARFNSGKRRFLDERGSSLKTFVDILCNEFQHCENALKRAGL